MDAHLLAGEYPGHPSTPRARDKVNILVDQGMRTFVDLTTPEDRLSPYADLVADAATNRQLDLRHLPFPIPDQSVLDNDAGYDLIVAAIAEGAERGAVFVHCWGGVGRTGTVVGCVLADAGLTDDAITARLTELREGTRKAARMCPENARQRQVITRRVEQRLTR